MKRVLCTLLPAILLFLSGCASQEKAEKIVLASGSEESEYYSMAQVLSACAFSQYDGAEITIAGSEAPGAQMAICLADEMQGREDFQCVATLAYCSVHFAAREEIPSLSDLAGRRIFIGADGEETAGYAREILRAVGLSDTQWTAESGDFIEWTLFDTDPQSVAVYFGLAPCPPLSVHERKQPLFLVGATEAECEAVTGGSGRLVTHTIPAGTYETQDEAVRCLAVPVVLAASTQVSDKTVEAVTALLYENRELISLPCAQLRTFAAQDMQADVSAPFHSGAKKFYDRAE